MNICLVTTFPPSAGGLSEYGFHIAQELQRIPSLRFTVLADELPAGNAELDGFPVERCWSYDRPSSVVRLVRTVNRLKPDVVWFNLIFGTFGHSPVVAFSGLMTPLLVRLTGCYTHVTLHHLMDTVDLKDAGVRHEWLYHMAGALATRGVLLSNSVSVLIPRYRKILNDKYGRDNVYLRSHGILAHRPEVPDFSRRGSPTHRILAFGKWGTYKRLELMIEAFALVGRELPDAKLVIAGGDHPQATGYVESVKRQHANNPSIEFCGYVPEDELAELFQGSTVTVLPYSSSTGCSGVAHLACTYGVPIVCSDLLDFRQMAQSEELAIEFFPPGSAEGLANCLIELLQNSSKQWGMAIQNFTAGLRMTMPNVVQKYVRHFELEQRTQALRAVARVRRIPRWMPAKSLSRFLIRNSGRWLNNGRHVRGTSSDRLIHSNGDGRGNLNGTGGSTHGDGIHAGAAHFGSGDSAAGGGNGHHRSQSESTQDDGRVLAAHRSADHNNPGKK
ncbi:MAG TPA: glycosyltransferase [Verrucomicrobiae bacterium]|nr:glycosyltransferase [Verrucomicrobiae bacterium]